MRYDLAHGLLMINPHHLPTVLRDNLRSYGRELFDPTNLTLRTNFERRFDFDNP
jgi:hypothetical protein